MHILILSTGTPSSHLLDAITERKHTYEIFNPQNLAINISEQSGYDRIYDAKESLNTPIRLKANSFDAVISRIGADVMHSASILRHLTDNLNVFSPQTANGILIASDKLWSYQVLSQHRVRTINTYFTRRANHVKFFVEQLGGLPIVGKTPTGSKGRGVFILDSILSANSVLGLLHNQDIPVMLQRFVQIPKHKAGNMVSSAEGKRLIVVGDKVVSAMIKTNYNVDDFRDNIDRGAKGKSIIPESWEVELAVNSAKALGLQFAGIDLIEDKEGLGSKTRKERTFVIEVNSNPGVGIISISGINHFIDLVKLIEEKTLQSKKDSSGSESAENSNILFRTIDNKLLMINAKRSLNEKLSEGENDFLEKYNSIFKK